VTASAAQPRAYTFLLSLFAGLALLLAVHRHLRRAFLLSGAANVRDRTANGIGSGGNGTCCNW